MTADPEARCRYCGGTTYVSDFDGPAHPCCRRAFDTGSDYCLSCHRRLSAPGTLPDPTAPMPGKVGRHHPATARRAAYLFAHKIGGEHSKLLDRLLAVWPGGLTAYEASKLVDRSPNQTATRFQELREEHWVEYLVEDGRQVERPTTPGNTGLVQRLTAEGYASIRRT